MSDQSEPMPDDHSAAHERLRAKDQMLDHRVKDNKERLDDHEDRIAALERWQYFCYGIAAAVGAAATYVLRTLGIKE